jgi:hypothetical protein
MKKARELYHTAKKTKIELQDLALNFYREYISHCEEEAEKGSLFSKIYRDNIPEKLRDVFEELVIPLFKDEGFTVTKKYASPYFNACCTHWIISWEQAYE